jgi:hypothetical protein
MQRYVVVPLSAIAIIPFYLAIFPDYLFYNHFFVSIGTYSLDDIHTGMVETVTEMIAAD